MQSDMVGRELCCAPPDPLDGDEEEGANDESKRTDEFDEGTFLSPPSDPEDEDGDDDEDQGDEDDGGGDWEDNPFDGPANPDY